MTGRTRVQSLAASPTMVGAITTLIVIVAVFLAYNANQGLPFVPTYRVSAEMPNAARLAPNNEVRIGGNRIGVIETIETTTNPENGEVAAKVNMKLDKTAEPIPEDSVVRVRYKSSFGLKYLEIERGEGEGLPEGGTLPIAQAAEQVEFDDIANTFDTETRENSRINLEGFGSAFAARGGSLNEAITNLNPLFQNLQPVANTLIQPATRLDRFFPELGDAARIVAPVAAEQAELFTNMGITFAAISSDPDALRATISEGPPTLETAIRSLPAQRPFLAKFAEFSRIVRPGVKELRRALPNLNSALKIGAPVLRRTPPMNVALGGAFGELERLIAQPQTKITLTRLTDTFAQVNPLVQHVVPYQTVCNYWYSWFTYLPEHLEQRDQVGYSQRVTLISPPGSTTPTNRPESPLGAYGPVPANGRRIRNPGEPTPPPNSAGPPTGIFEPQPEESATPARHGQPVLNGPPYDSVVGPGGAADCQPGQTGYLLGDQSENSPTNPTPGQEPRNPSINHIPGLQGPTYFGRPFKP